MRSAGSGPRGTLAIAALAAAAALPMEAAGASDWPSFRGDAQLTGVARDPLREPLATRWTFQAASGIESTAAISGGTVYVGTVEGTLHALDLAGGSPRWAYAAGQPIKSSPTVAGGLVYVGDEGGTLHAVDAATGKRRWVFQAEASIVSSAALADGRVIFGSNDNNVYALSATDGTLAWKLSTGSYVYATPAVMEAKGGSSVVVAGCDGLLRVVRVKDGAETMKVDVGGYMGASAAVAGTRAFVGNFENQFVAIDLKKGAVAWKYEHPEKKFPYYASAALSGDLVVVGGRDKMVRALRQATGEAVWTTVLGGRVDASPVVAGGRVVAATVAGELLLLDLASGKTVWQFETGASLAASPSVGGGFLIIGNTAGTLFAFGNA